MSKKSNGNKYLPWDIGESLFAVGLAVLGFLCLRMCWNYWFSFWIAALCNTFAAVMLLEAALRSIRPRKIFVEIPHRIAALLILPCLLVALVCSFGNMYVRSGGVRQGDMKLQSPMDAAYFSTVTITTVGYGDFTPTTAARGLVIWQLASGFLLLLIALPILASRLALFNNDCLLTVTANQRGALISVDGIKEVTTPFSSRVPEGKHTVKITSGDKRWEGELHLSAGVVTINAMV